MNRTGNPVSKRATKRGQPLVVLVILLFGWVTARAAVWEMPLADPQVADPQVAGQSRPIVEPLVQVSPSRTASVAEAAKAVPHQLERPHPALENPVPEPWITVMPYTPPPALLAVPLATPTPLAPRVAAGHQMLWLAAVAQLPLPAVLFEQRGDNRHENGEGSDRQMALIDKPMVVRSTSARRWSADSWLLLRQGEAVTVRNGFSAPSYGASQIGAVIRYRLAPDNPRKPALYLRATGAARTPHDPEVAAGFSARPLARIPVVAMAEVRASRNAGAIRLRPAVALVSEFPPLDLPLGLRAEAYAQAGYVGGGSASAFADGQLHLTRKLARIGGMELRAGGAAWGGAQQGASRIDVGPTAALGLPIGRANARLSADWRFRIAGSAAPGSGPAVTLSAGF